MYSNLAVSGGFVVGRVEIVHPSGQTGVHDREVLVGQGEVEHQGRFVFVDQGDGLRHVVGIHPVGADGSPGPLKNVLGDPFALFDGPACQDDIGKNFGRLGAFIHGYPAYAPGADDQYARHFF